MNETIGVKGGHNDRIRTIKITENQKQKLEQIENDKKIKQIETEIKKQQCIIAIEIIPTLILGNILSTIIDPKKDGKDSRLVSHSIEKQKQTDVKVKEKPKDTIEKTKIIEDKSVERKEEKPNEISLTTSQEVAKSNEEKLLKLKNHKIVDEYLNKLEDDRLELKSLIYDYKLIVNEEYTVDNSKDTEKLLDRLDKIIKKLEELKKCLEIEEIDKYDDNYIYTLIEEYLNEFKNNNFVKEIKDSDLYVEISNKIDELDKKKDKLKSNLETKKEEYEYDEEKLEELKKNKEIALKLEEELEKFVKVQKANVEITIDRIKKSATEHEKITTQIRGINNTNRRLLSYLAIPMMSPGLRTIGLVSLAVRANVELIRGLMNPQLEVSTEKYTIVEDYGQSIKGMINSIEDVKSSIKIAYKELTDVIKEFEEEFKDYIDLIPECRQVLDELEDIKDDIKEKNYEIEKIKKEQEKNLEINNAKVLRYNYS